MGNTRAKALRIRFKEGWLTPPPLVALNHKFQPIKIVAKHFKISKKRLKTICDKMVKRQENVYLLKRNEPLSHKSPISHSQMLQELKFKLKLSYQEVLQVWYSVFRHRLCKLLERELQRERIFFKIISSFLNVSNPETKREGPLYIENMSLRSKISKKGQLELS